MNKLELFEKLVKDREDSYKTFQKKSMQGFAKGVVDKYSETAHFLLEMLQNADDAGASTVKISLFENRIVLIHNGKDRFEISDPEYEDFDTDNGTLGHINSITSIGNTTKNESQNEDSNKIGKFGVGFKSVFQYCDEPEIYDNPFSFKIKYLFVPELIKYEESNLRETKFIFNFKPELDKEAVFNEIKKKLMGLSDNILFLNNIKEIEWNDNVNNDKGTYLKDIEIRDRLEYLTILESTIIDNNPFEKTNEFLRFYSTVEKNEISILFKMENGNIVTRVSPYPYCFFPLIGESQILNFYFHAPFLLNESREKINWNIGMKEWNQILIDGLADVLCESVIKLRDNKLLDYKAFNTLPIKEISQENKFYPIYAKFKELMKTEQLIPSIKEGQFMYATNSFIPDTKDISKLFISEDLQVMFKRDSMDWVDKNITNSGDTQEFWKFLKNIVRIEEITHDKIINNFNDIILLNKTDEYFFDFYDYMGDRVKEFKDKILKLKIIKLADESLIEPYDNSGKPKCFLPSDFKINVPFVKKCIVDEENSNQFFVNIGLKEYDIIDHLEFQIFPKYEKGNFPDSSNELFEDHKIIIQAMTEASSKKKDELINKLKYLKFLKGFIKKENKYNWCRPNDIYLNSQFTGNTEIEVFFKELGIIDEIIFLDDNFYEIYKDNLLILEEFGCKSEFDESEEIEKFLISKYDKHINVKKSDNLNHLRFFTKLAKKFSLNNYLKELFSDFKMFKCKDYKGKTKWLSGSDCYFPNEELKILFKDSKNVYFLMDYYLLEDIDFEFFRVNSSLKIRSVKPDYLGYVNISNSRNNYKRGVNNFDPYASIEYLEDIFENDNSSCYNRDKFIILWNYLINHLYLIKGIVESSTNTDYFIKTSEEKFSLIGQFLLEYNWIYPVNEAVNNISFDYHISQIYSGSDILKIDLESPESKKLASFFGVHIHDVNIEEAKLALGIKNDDVLNFAQNLDNLPPTIRKTIMENYKSFIDKQKHIDIIIEIVDPTDPERRKQKMRDKMESAPHRTKTVSERSVANSQTDIDPIKYLDTYYKKKDSYFCQICLDNMPFKYNQSDYTETIRIIDNNDIIDLELEESFLLLCPVCAEKHKLLKKKDEFVQEFIRRILEPNPVEHKTKLIEIKLPIHKSIEPAPKNIYFHPKHLLDIQTILKAENENNQPDLN